LDNSGTISKFTRVLGQKQYEIQDHLGNVKVVFNDYKEPVSGGSGSEKYDLNVLSLLNYYPFGMSMPGMGYEAGGSRYGFNGMEKDDVIKGVGNSYDFGGRNLYSSRLGRFNSNDPFERKFAFKSPLVFAGNNPILNIDAEGKFSRQAHDDITRNALEKADIINSDDIEDIIDGNIDADGGESYLRVFNYFDADLHFDNVSNTKAVNAKWGSINKALLKSDLTTKEGRDDFGMVTHTVQDFYSHSNYIEKYIEYHKEKFGVAPNIDDIPTYDNRPDDFNKEIHTGSFSIFEYITPSSWWSDDTHVNMNKDDDETNMGKKIEIGANGKPYNLHTAARGVAERHTTKITIKAKSSSNDSKSYKVPEKKHSTDK